MNNPFEYYNGKLGFQSRFIVSGRDAHSESLCLISTPGLSIRIKKRQTIQLRLGKGCNSPALVQFDTLLTKWQEAIVRMWGNPPKLIQQSLFEKKLCA